MSGFQCPYCSAVMPLIKGIHTQFFPAFDESALFDPSQIELNFYKCAYCSKYTITARGRGDDVHDVNTCILPTSTAKQYPDYIPPAIRQDYEEAYATLKLSPKASATLSRRCLQGMIRDYWNISKNTLFEEINELKNKIPSDVWNAIDALRQLGNIGAHMQKDTNVIVEIDPDEAQQLVNLIELLMKEWYINRHERANLLSNIIQTNESKQQLRKNTE